MMVDIILAVYNGEKYLKELLDSILNQSFSDFKIIAGDDNSRDGSKSVLEEYSEKFPGKFELHFFDFEKSCAKDNFLRLLEYSHSDFIMFADQDDIWKQNKIEEALKALKNEDSSIPLLYHTDLEELCQAEYMEKYRSQSEIIGDLKRRRVRRKHVGETSLSMRFNLQGKKHSFGILH